MKVFLEKDLNELSKIYRLNLINSCTGYKSANLMGTVSTDGKLNLTVFSSVTHLGSNPALVGCILRPTTVPRDTFKNLIETGWVTINHIHKDIIEDAHHTSAKYASNVSEFDQTNLEPEFSEQLPAPYVKGCAVQLGCRFLNQYHIKENDTLLLVLEIIELRVREDLIKEDGWIQLDQANTVAINGLDGYTLPQLISRFEYARPTSNGTKI